MLSFIIGKSIQIAIYDPYIARFDKDLKIIINVMLKSRKSKEHTGPYWGNSLSQRRYKAVKWESSKNFNSLYCR